MIAVIMTYMHIVKPLASVVILVAFFQVVYVLKIYGFW